jgi:hypothetical protein
MKPIILGCFILLAASLSSGNSQGVALVGSKNLITSSSICDKKCVLLFNRPIKRAGLQVFAYKLQVTKLHEIKIVTYRNSKNILVDARLAVVTQEAPGNQYFESLKGYLQQLTGTKFVLNGFDIEIPRIETARMPDGERGDGTREKCEFDVPYFRSDIGQKMIELYQGTCPSASLYVYRVSLLGERTINVMNDDLRDAIYR